jgi:hypothetical protein
VGSEPFHIGGAELGAVAVSEIVDLLIADAVPILARNA